MENDVCYLYYSGCDDDFVRGARGRAVLIKMHERGGFEESSVYFLFWLKF